MFAPRPLRRDGSTKGERRMDRCTDSPSSAFVGRDRFVDDRLPPRREWPDLTVAEAGLRFPDPMNAADMLLAPAAARRPDKTAIIGEYATWRYDRLSATTDAIAHVLVRDFGLRPGGRVLLRGPNSPWLAACWLATIKAGGVATATLPLLRAAELAPLIEKTRPTVALCDMRSAADLDAAVRAAGVAVPVCRYDGGGDAWAGSDKTSADETSAGETATSGGGETAGRLEDMARAHLGEAFVAAPCAPDDPALICFSSGTTGSLKAAVHFHRDLIAVADLSPRSILRVHEDDVFCGSPGLAFAYGLGGLLLFPLRVGATSVLLERATPEKLFDAVVRHRGTVLFAVPTAYRALIDLARRTDAPRDAFAGLRVCVAAGEPLPAPAAEAWAEVAGTEILDSLGTTEMLNAVLHARPGAVRSGAVGQAVPGYEVRIVDADMNDLPVGEVGLLAVRGPTGCRYLDDPRQTAYVRDGWNLTGDSGRLDEDGFFYHHGRSDDLIVSGGYKFSGLEVEDVLLTHDAVAECAVVAGPDRLRGSVPYAFIVTRDARSQTAALAAELQEFVKDRLAAFKYPRFVAFIDELPRTETGKIKRYRLRQQAGEAAGDEDAAAV